MARSVSPHSGGTVPDSHRVPFPLTVVSPETSIAPVRMRLVTTWLPIVAWAAVIFTLSGIPSLSTGLGTWDLVLRKLAHVTEFAILGWLLARALAELPAFATGVVYAATDELHQHFVPGREGAVLDVAIDAVGVLAGILLLRLAHDSRLVRRRA